MSMTAQKPDVEIRRKHRDGSFSTYATAYWRPLRVWVLGRWLVGKPRR